MNTYELIYIIKPYLLILSIVGTIAIIYLIFNEQIDKLLKVYGKQKILEKDMDEDDGVS